MQEISMHFAQLGKTFTSLVCGMEGDSFPRAHVVQTCPQLQPMAVHSLLLSCGHGHLAEQTGGHLSHWEGAVQKQSET